MKKILVMFFDITFILILCFIILLMTMIMTKNTVTGVGSEGYVINIPMLAVTVGAVLVFLYFVTRISGRELRKMLKDNYLEKSAEDDAHEN